MAKKGEVLNRQTFISKFNSIASHKHRYEVFSDFIIYVALELHNTFIKALKAESFFKNFNDLEQEFIKTVTKYNEQERQKFFELFFNLMMIFESEPEPKDILGSIFMELELSNERNGQFFTPPEVADLMAMMSYGDALVNFDKPFITLSEPACGAGSMILSFAKVMVKNNINPTEKLWVQAVDIDRISAFMCYIQLFLYEIPAEIIVGNSLTLEVRERYFTPQHYIGNWNDKLRLRRMLEVVKEICEPVKPTEDDKTGKAEAEPTEKQKIVTVEPQLLPNNGKPQLDFFDLFIES